MSNGISETPAAGIGKLLMESRFIVPNHQRDYSWTEDEVRQLFEDIDSAIDNKNLVYFVGLMVFLASDSGELIVLDGQQRLATAVIIFSAIRSWLQQYDARQKDASQIQEWVIGRSELGEKQLQPRMTLNAANHKTFDDFIIHSVALSDTRAALAKLKKQDRNRRLLEATVFAHERIAAVSAKLGAEAAAAYLFKLVKYMRDSVGVVRLSVSSENAAYTIFETLNDRGLELSPLDLVKNHLFSKADEQSPISLRDMEARWAQMMATLANVKPDSFLKAFWTSRHGRIRTNDLFEAFKKQYATADLATELSIDVLEAAEQYAALDTADDPVWSAYPEAARQTVRALKIVGSQQTHPVMLAALKRLSVTEVERLLRLLEVLVVRYLLVAGGNPGRFETTCAKVARGIYAQEIQSATQAFQEFKDVYPADAEFQHAFMVKQERSNQKAQYLLRLLEREEIRLGKGAMAGEWAPGSLTVEHIFPKSPGENWSEALIEDPSLLEDGVFRIGNLCLLTNVNKDLGNAPFEEKKKTYVKSDLITTNTIASETAWTRKSIEHRQAHLAKLATAVWRFQ